MNFKAVNRRVLLAQWNKSDKEKGSNPFASLPTNSNIAEVAYFDEKLVESHPWIKKGLKVVYGKETQSVYVDGTPLISMDISNVLMIEEEEFSEHKD